MRLAAVYFPEKSQFGENTINFGGRFNYKIKLDSNTVNLVRTTNDNFIVDFFSKDISNINVIVGKNGTGKTSLLLKLLKSEDLVFVYENDQLIHKNDWYVSLSKNYEDPLLGIKNFTHEVNNLNLNIDILSEKNHYGLSISNNTIATPKFYYYSPLSNFNSATKYKDSFTINSDSVYEIKSQTLQRQVSFLIQQDLIESLKKVYHDFPIYENIKIKIEEFINPDLSNLDFSFYTFFKNNNFKKLKGLQELKIDKEILKSYEIDVKNQSYYKIFEQLSIKSKKLTGRKRIYFEIYTRLVILIFCELGFKKLDKITTVINILMNDDILSDSDFIFTVKSLIERTINLSEKSTEGALIELFEKVENLIRNIFESIPENLEYKNLEISLNVLYDNYFKFIKLIDDHCHDFLSDYELHFLKFESDKNLSQGEEYLLNLFSSIYSNEYIGNHSNAILLLDEPDLGFHPQWKKKLVNALSKVLPQLIKKTKPVELGVEKTNIHKSLQIIFTTHNPLTLSDMPGDKIIYLDKIDNKFIINKSNILKKSFGANINELLADGFFLMNDLMGEFAKEKIEVIIAKLNYFKLIDKKSNFKKDNKEEIKKIDSEIKLIKDKINFEINEDEISTERIEKNIFKTINLIGEPVVRFKLLEMYEEVFVDNSKFKKVNQIKRLIEESGLTIEDLE